MVPTNRSEFKNAVLMSLGKGAVKVNVTDDQVDLAVDRAMKLAQDYHFDFVQRTFYRHQITSDDITNKYIDLPTNVIGAVRIFDLSDVMFGGGIFNAQFQFVYQNIWEWQSNSMIPYFIGFQQMQFIEQILLGKQPIRYNRYENRLYVDMDWERVTAGQYLIVECDQVVAPESYSKMWSDHWFFDYTAALVKYQWGQNLSKFTGLPGPGNLQFNGDKIKAEAQEEIDKLKIELRGISLPPEFLIG